MKIANQLGSLRETITQRFLHFTAGQLYHSTYKDQYSLEIKHLKY